MDLDPEDLLTPTLNINELLADGEAQRQEEAQRAPLTLGEVVALAERLTALHGSIAAHEVVLEELNNEAHELSDKVLPRALQDLKLNGLDLATGEKLILAEVVNLSVSDGNRAAVHTWLREVGCGDLIKNEVTVTFGKGEDDEASKLVKLVSELRKADGLKCGGVAQQERVHPQTLLAFVKRRLAAAEPVPQETLKLYQAQRCMVEKPKLKI